MTRKEELRKWIQEEESKPKEEINEARLSHLYDELRREEKYNNRPHENHQIAPKQPDYDTIRRHEIEEQENEIRANAEQLQRDGHINDAYSLLVALSNLRIDDTFFSLSNYVRQRISDDSRVCENPDAFVADLGELAFGIECLKKSIVHIARFAHRTARTETPERISRIGLDTTVNETTSQESKEDDGNTEHTVKRGRPRKESANRD